ncbi:MAG: aminomethyl-transferring glycine dehydrogenase [Lautropia sp.]|nr:aminomethyl-transferring glycine dehydrogenase [Lautropia sp.]
MTDRTPSAHLDGLLGQQHQAFVRRHIGPDAADEAAMLATIGTSSLNALIGETVPAGILLDPGDRPALAVGDGLSEAAALDELAALASRNQVWRSYLGSGYHNTLTPEPIRRNVLENPGWYTAYTPYQAEVSQGRLEALMVFQQMIIDLTGMDVANASLLDEATAAAEAMTMLRRASTSKAAGYFVEAGTHPQVIDVIRTRARWLAIPVQVGSLDELDPGTVYGAHLQSPDTEGRVFDHTDTISRLQAAGVKVCLGTDLLAALLLKSAGAQGADVVIGSAQRFGVPLGFGGPHAAFMATRQKLIRMMPGRIIGLSRDASGNPAYRMALQTREQHIRRDKATSNICTAQALLANMAAFYAVYHGPEGLRQIAWRTHGVARLLAASVQSVGGPSPVHANWFDTLVYAFPNASATDQAVARAAQHRINLRRLSPSQLLIALDETVGLSDVADLHQVITGQLTSLDALQQLTRSLSARGDVLPAAWLRDDEVLGHEVFHRFRSETEFVRYLKRLENRDISLVHSMIPLGSCTMKLNAAAEMAPISWPGFAAIHPLAPETQTEGYREMLGQLGDWLADITGFAGVSFQPNSGAQGEYAGLQAIREYQIAQGQGHRDVCLIPASAHGTNPASAQMMDLKIVVVACDRQGNVDLADLAAKIDTHRDRLSALMITYPSTHGVFEAAIRDICAQVHQAGGQVYMDGANMNAQAGLTKPGEMGADVCHLNLHKTFCIPHGGGGPGMGPIAVAEHLVPHLPGDPASTRTAAADDAAPSSVSAAAHGSALITTISWMYIRMMGSAGIRRATAVAILNANYIACRLKGHFEVLYTGEQGRVAHECILDLRDFKRRYGVTAEDVAKRLMDYGFHAPTLSFPVPDTLMVEPTESEGRAELDRFCDAMISIRQEIADIEAGKWPADDNPLKQAPHTALEVAGEWTHPYSREQAVYPLPWLRAAKVWPSVKRIDNAAGDRNPVCSCPPMSDYQ